MIRNSQCRHGMFVYETRDSIQGRSLSTYGEYCEVKLQSMLNRLIAGDVVIDVGAGIGCFTVPMAKKVGSTGCVYAYEPERRSFYTLCANVALNDAWNVFCEQRAIANCGGIAQIPDAPMEDWGSITLDKSYDGIRHGVRLYRIDDLNLVRCNLIKIDTNGSESIVLAGAEQTIKRCQPVLFIQTPNLSMQKIIDQLTRWSYGIITQEISFFQPNNYYKAKENVFAMDAQQAMSRLIIATPRIAGDKSHLMDYLHGNGLDLSPKRSRLPSGNGGCITRLHDPVRDELSPSTANNFDYVYSNCTLQDVEDVPSRLLTWCRAVKPGGYLYLVIPEYKKTAGWSYKATFSTEWDRTKFDRSSHFHIKENLIPILKNYGVVAIELRLDDHLITVIGRKKSSPKDK